MYLNERAWQEPIENEKNITDAMFNFLRIYKELKERHQVLYVPKGLDRWLNSNTVPLGKWINSVDPTYRLMYLEMWDKRKEYEPEQDIEFQYKEVPLISATEALVNNSFVLSVATASEWETDVFEGKVISLESDEEETTQVLNVCNQSQLQNSGIQEMLQPQSRWLNKIYDYKEMWRRRKEIFEMLDFCPSVEQNLSNLQRSYFSLVLQRLLELEQYCETHTGMFSPDEIQSKTTPESSETLNKYCSEHTFVDENGEEYLASWHIRFTGIPGRIFFVPNYHGNRMLICYIGKKLPNVSY